MFNFECVLKLFEDDINYISNNSHTIIFFIYTLLHVLYKMVYFTHVKMQTTKYFM